MQDLADAFSDEEEVRSAIGAADQTTQQLATAAWAQSRRRAPAILRALAAGQYTAMRPQRAGRNSWQDCTTTTQPRPALRQNGKPFSGRAKLYQAGAAGPRSVSVCWHCSTGAESGCICFAWLLFCHLHARPSQEVSPAAQQGHVTRRGLYEDMGTRGRS